jgi:hypothetical protein
METKVKSNLVKKIKFIILSLVCLFIFSAEVFAQKSSEKTLATDAVKTFYHFHFSHNDDFSEKQVALRNKFFTPKLTQLFYTELKRQQNYLKKYPDNKPYFEGLPFQPIEFCQKDYRVRMAQIKQRMAIVKVNFVYGKSSCAAKDGALISYQILLSKIDGKWLIDDIVYENFSKLTGNFEIAAKIK